MSGAVREEREFGRFAILLAALALFFVTVPLISDKGPAAWLFRLGSTGLIFASVYATSSRRWPLAVAVVLSLPALVAKLGSQQSHGLAVAEFASTAALLFYNAGLVLHVLLRQQRVSADTIMGGINVYLLLIIGFTYLHGLVIWIEPSSYTSGGQSVMSLIAVSTRAEVFTGLLYFSVVVFTTLGFGDIVPASPMARMLCSVEAIIGQLYVAIFIAGLIALYVGRRNESRR